MKKYRVPILAVLILSAPYLALAQTATPTASATPDASPVPALTGTPVATPTAQPVTDLGVYEQRIRDLKRQLAQAQHDLDVATVDQWEQNLREKQATPTFTDTLDFGIPDALKTMEQIKGDEDQILDLTLEMYDAYGQGHQDHGDKLKDRIQKVRDDRKKLMATIAEAIDQAKAIGEEDDQ